VSTPEDSTSPGDEDIARAIYEALCENDPTAFIGTFELRDPAMVADWDHDGSVTFDGRLDLLLLVRQLRGLLSKRPE
jgi:hypothetical protein